MMYVQLYTHEAVAAWKYMVNFPDQRIHACGGDAYRAWTCKFYRERVVTLPIRPMRHVIVHESSQGFRSSLMNFLVSPLSSSLIITFHYFVYHKFVYYIYKRLGEHSISAMKQLSLQLARYRCTYGKRCLMSSRTVAVPTGIEPVFLDRQSSVITFRPRNYVKSPIYFNFRFFKGIILVVAHLGFKPRSCPNRGLIRVISPLH